MTSQPPYIFNTRRILDSVTRCWGRSRNAFFSLLFPRECPGCFAGLPFPASLCDDCACKLKRIEPPFCEKCGIPFPSAWTVRRCADCRIRRSPVTMQRSVFSYEGLVRQMVRAIKYRGDGRFIRFFAEELFVRAQWNVRWDAVVPVPLHRTREWHRKFNQAALLAEEYSRISGIAVWRGLVKRKPTPAQSSLSNLGRQKNLRNAFACKSGMPVPRKILLIDDVITTGSTVAECARVLRRAGAKRVYALSIARVLKQF